MFKKKVPVTMTVPQESCRVAVVPPDAAGDEFALPHRLTSPPACQNAPLLSFSYENGAKSKTQ